MYLTVSTGNGADSDELGRLARQESASLVVHMAEKRTKADKAQRQADQLEKKARHPGPKRKKKASARTSAKLLDQ